MPAGVKACPARPTPCGSFFLLPFLLCFIPVVFYFYYLYYYFYYAPRALSPGFSSAFRSLPSRSVRS